MTKPLFEHRHFTWLAHWAKANLDADAIKALASDLQKTNAKFDIARFIAAATAKPINWRDEARCNIVPNSP